MKKMKNVFYFRVEIKTFPFVCGTLDMHEKFDFTFLFVQ